MATLDERCAFETGKNSYPLTSERPTSGDQPTSLTKNNLSPFSRRPPSTEPKLPTPGFCRLPTEIHLQIADLSSLPAIATLSLVSRHLRKVYNPELYGLVENEVLRPRGIWDYTIYDYFDHIWADEDPEQRLYLLMEENDPFEQLPSILKRKWQKLTQFLLPINPNMKHLEMMLPWDSTDTSDFDNWKEALLLKPRQLAMIHAIERQKVAMFEWMVKREVFLDEWRGQGVFWHLVSNLLEIGNEVRTDTEAWRIASLSKTRPERPNPEYWATSNEVFEESLANYEAMIKILIDNGCDFTKDPAEMLNILELIFHPTGTLENYFAEGEGIDLSGTERVHRAERILTAIFLPILQISGTTIPVVNHEETSIIPPLHWALQKWTVLSPDFREEFIFGLLFGGADVNESMSIDVEGTFDYTYYTPDLPNVSTTPIMRVIIPRGGFCCVPNEHDQIWLLKVLIEFGAQVSVHWLRQDEILGRLQHLLSTDLQLKRIVLRACPETVEALWKQRATQAYEEWESDCGFSKVSVNGLEYWEDLMPSAPDDTEWVQDDRD